MKNKFLKIVISTGGTGGHVIPAYSLAKHFLDKKKDVKIISDYRGLRYLNKFESIKIIKIISTSIFKKNPIRIIFSMIMIFISIIQSFLILILNRPNLVFGMGGYASFPICIASIVLRIPIIIYENNLIIGRTNKYLLPFAKRIFVSNKTINGIHLKYQSKICYIGNIIRKEILNFERPTKKLDKNEKLRILVLGGSQAAKVFADKLPVVIKRCVENKILLSVYQQCLPNQSEYLSNFYKNLKIDFEIFNYSDDLLSYFSKSNISITRAGSSMLAELINIKMPFIAIPLPTSSDNHQLKNAIYYEKNRFGYLVEEKDFCEKVFDLIKKINVDKSLLNSIIKNQGQFSDKSVYDNIEEEINKLENEKH